MTTRFCDQFSPLLIGQDRLWSSSDSTLIRMPLTTECMEDGLESGLRQIKQLTDRLFEHASRVLLFLKSIVQVELELNFILHYRFCLFLMQHLEAVDVLND